MSQKVWEKKLKKLQSIILKHGKQMENDAKFLRLLEKRKKAD